MGRKLTAQQKAQIQNLAKQGDFLAAAILDANDDRVIEGLMAGTPSTASTQATGAGATDWNVNVDKGLVVVDGVVKEFAAQVDLDVHSVTNLLANGQSCVAAIVAKKVGAVISLQAVKGAAATTGSEKAPSDAAIQAAVGAGNTWVRVAECTLNRTGDLAVTQSQNNTKRDFGLALQ